MTPHVLLVDDSEAFLAYVRAALSGHCAVSTVTSGAEALDKAALLKPDAILLDLSMPEMDGDEVLGRLKANPELEAIPVVIVSSEHERGARCLDRGAAAFVPKPARAEDLREALYRVVEEARQLAGADVIAIMPVGVGDVELALPLESLRAVVLQPATLPLPGGPFYLARMFDFHGEIIAIVDLALRLRMTHALPLVERKLVVVDTGTCALALSVDHVRDPEEILHTRMRTRAQLGVEDHRPLGELLVGVVTTERGPLAVLEPKALLSQRLLLALPSLVGKAVEELREVAR